MSTLSPEINHLLDEVFANPDDDAARLVLSDALIEANDPRGHFIALQFGKSAGKVDPKREQKLQKQFGDQWCAPFAPALVQRTFERGFLGRATVREEALLSSMIGARNWTTVRTLTLLRGGYGYQHAANNQNGELTRDLLLSEPIRRWTRTVENISAQIAENVLGASSVTRHWRSVSAHTRNPSGLVLAISKMSSANMPELRDLIIFLDDKTSMSEAAHGGLLSAAVTTSLEHLTVSSESNDSALGLAATLADYGDRPRRLDVEGLAGKITIDFGTNTITVGHVRSVTVLNAVLTKLSPLSSTIKEVRLLRPRNAYTDAYQKMPERDWQSLEAAAARVAQVNVVLFP